MISAKNEAIDVLKLRILSFMHMHCLNTNMPLLRIGVFNYASIFKKLFMLRFVYEGFESMSLPQLNLRHLVRVYIHSYAKQLNLLKDE
ncbi:hypothetical protein T4A_3 [Trichinella pseudospiralis]|uniref:Uncharacterized protein n=1 Tax=Trichinella pseudospiralis TaxID=6337 RepID=A0A0V1DX15_TRIPS|nr:hypothetical protein T4A_3 [Trichinella pseudospiralis]